VDIPHRRINKASIVMAAFSRLVTSILALSLIGLAAASEPPGADAPEAQGAQDGTDGTDGTQQADEPPPKAYPEVSLDFARPHALVTPAVTTQLRMDGVCPKDEVVRMPALPEDFNPWTHIPYCMTPADRERMMFCAATSAHFHEGRGISLLGFGPYLKDLENVTNLGQKWSVRNAEKKYEMRRTATKGNGLFVKKGKPIKAGEVIMVDYPTLLESRDIQELFAPDERQRIQWMGLLQLPDAGREATLALDKIGRYADELDNLITKNAIGLTINHHWKFLAVFPEVARVNHNCLPNAFYRYDDATFALELFALRDIREDEEITITYIDPNQGIKFAERQKLLGSQWGFECDCSICQAKAKRAESDRRRTKMNKLRTMLSDKKEDEETDLDMVLEVATELLELYEAEGMIVPRATAAEVIAYTYNQLGEPELAVEFGKRAIRYHAILAGDDSHEVKRLRDLVAAPKLHASWKPKPDAGDVVDEERLAKDGADTQAEQAGSDEDVVMAAVRAAMARAKKVAREKGVDKETEDKLVEEAVKAALKQAK
jgi:tetratricopeptide (TPR) repeat protein